MRAFIYLLVLSTQASLALGCGRAASPPSRPGHETDGPGGLPWLIGTRGPRRFSRVLDAATAIFAIAADADEREAYLREVERFGRSLPEGSYGRRNPLGHRRRDLGGGARKYDPGW